MRFVMCLVCLLAFAGLSFAGGKAVVKVRQQKAVVQKVVVQPVKVVEVREYVSPVAVLRVEGGCSYEQPAAVIVEERRGFFRSRKSTRIEFQSGSCYR